MPDSLDSAKLILKLRVAIRRFSPIFESDLSSMWTMLSEGVHGREESIRLARFSNDVENVMSIDDVELLQSSLGEVLDVLDEDPTGDVYYPYTAATLIELYCRSATGDLPDDAPASIDRWVARFARHVDWQLEKSRIPVPGSAFFAHQEEAFVALELSLSGNRDSAWLAAMEKSRQLGEQYLQHVTRAINAG